jgi:hypothetical protein
MRTFRFSRFLGASLSALLLLVTLAGCYGSLSAGGWMTSGLDSAKRATFGFSFDAIDKQTGQLDLERARLRGTYQDKGTSSAFPNGVSIRLAGVTHVSTGGYGAYDNCAEFTGTYTSQDRRHAGSGEVYVSVCDGGKTGDSKNDELEVSLSDGPYDGYSNYSPVLGGQVTGKQQYTTAPTPTP